MLRSCVALHRKFIHPEPSAPVSVVQFISVYTKILEPHKNITDTGQQPVPFPSHPSLPFPSPLTPPSPPSSPSTIVPLVRRLRPRILQAKHTPLNTVQHQVPRLKERIHRPRSRKLRLPSQLIVLRVTIKKPRLLDPASIRLPGHRAHIHDPQSRAIVRLITKPVDNILVVINADSRALVSTSKHGVSERGNVDDVSGGALVSRLAGAVNFVQLVV